MGLYAFEQRRGQQGMALVEFTIALPLLLLLLLALGEFGRMLFQYNTLLQASRDAGRYIASQAWNSTLGQVDLSNATLVTQTKNVAVYGVPATTGAAVVSGLTTSMVGVTAVGTDHVQVTITYTFCPVIGGGGCAGSITGLFANSIALRIPLVATTVMRAL
ncbi:TadE/TadG family type IV pilus assembly protein [Pseudomonas sp. 6D_7.1_Bac1]|jgi:Flp pilus assembly protein TadG|uniref:TadE/TadG family type IV pilus assembly protein n=1 Tax=Pseudomonas sp. 6D_7.1_Bac1 TaxID=2971615 RepID=UPI0021CADB4D|nr:TadE/TadG family type IV pilus assembly protein [Pseudomonas sp. 6D_7.1_Bac1]MCU1747945.1 pilus assembly protein [Pseudomonas sp. 6D_7.1_Bac1]